MTPLPMCPVGDITTRRYAELLVSRSVRREGNRDGITANAPERHVKLTKEGDLRRFHSVHKVLATRFHGHRHTETAVVGFAF